MNRATARTTIATDEVFLNDPLSVIDTFDHHHEIVDVVEIDYDDIDNIMSEPVVSDFDLTFTTADVALSGADSVQQHNEEPIIPSSNEDIFLFSNTEDFLKRRPSMACSTVSASSGGSKRSTWKETRLDENYELGTWDVVSLA